MPFLLSYWKQVAIGLVVLVFIGLVHHKGYVAGKAAVQYEWDAQKLVDAQIAAEAANKTATIVVNSNKGTQNANVEFGKSKDATKGYYSTHAVPGMRSSTKLCNSTSKTNSSKVSSVSNIARQSEESTANSVSSADYEKLANECLETTIQLNNAQEWAQEQVFIYNQN